jgi:hypothetical protein
MAALSLSIDVIRPLNRWDNSRIHPGSVGSVGDVNMTPRFKQSMPDLPMRFDPYFRGKKEQKLGSNVQNGTQASYMSKGLSAITVDSNWGGRRNFKTRRGYIYQDMRASDKLTEPLLGSTGDYTFQNKIATTYKARTTGMNFLPLPHGYIPSPGEVTRGGAFPFTRDYVPGNAPGSILETPTPSSADIHAYTQFRQANERDYKESKRYIREATSKKSMKPGK